MVQAIINLGEYEDRVLTIVKGKFGLKNKSEAINFVISKYEEDLLEPELKPEFSSKISNLDKKGKFKSYRSLSDLRSEIEHAWIFNRGKTEKETGQDPQERQILLWNSHEKIWGDSYLRQRKSL